MNTPYVKKFDKNGQLINPIEEIYKSEFQNRSERRKKLHVLEVIKKVFLLQ